MLILGVAIVLFIAPFLIIVFFGAPYVPTLRKDVMEAFDRISLRNKRVVDLGSGDGRILLYCAANGAEAVGYEINPWLWVVSWLRTRHDTNIRVRLQDFRQAELSQYDVVFVFTTGLHKKQIEELFSEQLNSGAYVFSNGFRFDSLEEVETVGSISIYKKSN